MLVTQEKSTAQAQLAESQSQVKALEADIKKAHAEREKWQATTSQLERQVADTTKALAAAKAATLAAAGPTTAGRTAPNKGGSAAMSGIAEMMKNPAMREIAKQQQLAMMDMQYSGLFAHLQLDDAEKTNLKQLLGERLGAQTDLGLKLIDTSLTPQQRKALVDQTTAATAASDEKIKTFMNDENDFATFKHWEETKGERQMLSMGQTAFASEPLTPQQETQLVDAMHSANARPSNVPDLNRPENFDPNKLTSADFDRQLVHYDANAQAAYDEAAKFLSPGQLAAFKVMQAQNRSMMEAGMKMSAAMFGSGKGK